MNNPEGVNPVGENAASLVKSFAYADSVLNNVKDRSGSSVSAAALANSIIAPSNDYIKLKPNALYPNEQLHVIQYDDVVWARLSGRNVHMGKLALTNYRLLFMDGSDKEVLAIPYGTICRVEKVGSQSTAAEGSYGIEVYCKDFRRVFFATRKVGKMRRHIFDDLYYRAFWDRAPWPTYARQYKESLTSSAEGEASFVRGWSIYRRLAEFERMRLPHDSGGPWHVDSLTNEKYEFCETYPCVLVYPEKFKPDLSSVSDESELPLFRIRDFRSKGRVPVLSWYNKQNHATICRCSQPMTGLSNRPCDADRDLFRAIADCNPSQGPALFIFDARPKMNARANMTKGGGYETYPEHKFEFLGIPNIHVMRDSLKKLEDLIYPFVKDNKSFFLNLDNCGWLWYVKRILQGAAKVAASVSYLRTSVVVHCSDGWDRTAQLTSLAMLMLDGYYRTLEGFMVLIEKEWLSFGHKFAVRVGHGDDHYGDGERSPIFLQFIDAVYQFHQQVNAAFEFNEWFLITVLDHLYSCQFGTFLCNSEKERLESGVFKNTVSLWSYVLDNKEEYLNPFYQPSSKDDIIIPYCSGRLMKLWTNYYSRNCVNFHSTLGDQVIRWKQLQQSKETMQKKIDELKKRVKSAAAKYKSSMAPPVAAAASVSEATGNGGGCDGNVPASIACLGVDDDIYERAMFRLNEALKRAEYDVLPSLPEDQTAAAATASGPDPCVDDEWCGGGGGGTACAIPTATSETEASPSDDDGGDDKEEDLHSAQQVSSF